MPTLCGIKPKRPRIIRSNSRHELLDRMQSVVTPPQQRRAFAVQTAAHDDCDRGEKMQTHFALSQHAFYPSNRMRTSLYSETATCSTNSNTWKKNASRQLCITQRPLQNCLMRGLLIYWILSLAMEERNVIRNNIQNNFRAIKC